MSLSASPPPLLGVHRHAAAADPPILWGFALLVGGLGAAAAILFRLLLRLTQAVAYGNGDDRFLSVAAGLPSWHLLLAPALGGLLVGWLVHRLPLPGRAPGIADVMEAVAVRHSRIGLREGLAGALASGVSLGVGASLGREGPAVHLGAAVGSAVGRLLRLPELQIRTLLGCGVAAAVAASFNAPLAGVLFAAEVVVHSAAARVLLPLLLAAAVGTGFGRAVFGELPAFALPQLPAPLPGDHALSLGLGVLAGAAAVLFVRAMVAAPTVGRRAGSLVGLPRALHPAIGGLALGVLALAWPEVLGVGYEPTDRALHGDYLPAALVGLLAAKVAAILLSAASGFPGGVFSPCLLLGALGGSALGQLAAAVWPAALSGASLHAMLGMAAFAGAVLGAPVSTLVIIFEMTGNYSATLAAMPAVAVACLILHAIAAPSIFHAQLERAGVALPGRPAP